MPLQELPVSVQTLYADLVEKAWTSGLADLMKAGKGSAYPHEVGGKRYWYWQPGTGLDGKRPSARYIGPDSEETRVRIEAMRAQVATLEDRRSMVRALAAARLPTPDRLSGEVMAALAEAGVFRLRAAVIGSVAFQCYPALLGVRVPATLSRTGDLDIAQFHSIAVAVDDEIDDGIEALLKRVDRRFDAIPDPMNSRRTLRYAVRQGEQELFSVDVLRPLRGPERERVTWLRAMRSHAQVIRFLDFLLYQEQNAVALHGPGIPINVPQPERFALHKMLVSQMRAAIPRSQIKARKDLEQASALIGILMQQRPDHLGDIWGELLDRGPSWRRKAFAAMKRLPVTARDFLQEAVPHAHADEMATALGLSRQSVQPLTGAEDDPDEGPSP